jgi:hypothetical protein
LYESLSQFSRIYTGEKHLLLQGSRMSRELQRKIQTCHPNAQDGLPVVPLLHVQFLARLHHLLPQYPDIKVSEHFYQMIYLFQ